MITLIPGQTDFLATMYSFGAMLSFTIAHVAVIQLRRGQAGVERPWKPPLNFRAFGAELPLSAILGGLGTFAAWIVVMALNPRTLAVGVGWMALGILVYVLYRRNQGLPLTETVKVLAPEPLGSKRSSTASVLVAFEDDQPFSEEMVATAAKARVEAATRNPYPLFAHRAHALAPSSRAARAGRRGPEQDRASEADRGTASHRARRAGPAGSGWIRDRRRGQADQRRRRSRRPAVSRRLDRSTTRPCKRCSASAHVA